MKLGARIFKTGLAVVLSFYIAELFNLEPAIFATIAAILTIQPSVFRSWEFMLQQLQANVIGAVFASIAYLTIGNEPIVIGLVTMLVIATNLKLKYDKSIVLSVVTVVAIMNVSEAQYLFFAVERFSLILVGVFSSIFINLVFFPPKYETKLTKTLKQTSEELSVMLRFLIDGSFDRILFKEENKKIEDKINKIEMQYLLYKDEFNRLIKKSKYSKKKKLIIFKRMISVIKKEHALIHLIEKHLIANPTVPTEVYDEVKEALIHLTSYNEKIYFKYDKSSHIKHPHEMPVHLLERNKLLAERLIAFYKQEELECWIHILPIISSLVELATEMEQLEKCIDNYLMRNHTT